MNLKEQISADFLTAFKGGEKEKKTFLGTLKAEILRIESNPQAEEWKFCKTADELYLYIVKKMEKSLKATNDIAELEFIAPYLPKLMGEDVIREKVRLIIIENGGKNLGVLMGLFNKQNAGLDFDNNVVSKIIREELV